jgi:hypothetical protein
MWLDMPFNSIKKIERLLVLFDVLSSETYSCTIRCKKIAVRVFKISSTRSGEY